MEKEKETLLQALIVICASFAIAPLLALWNAWAMSTIYGWFLADLPGAPKLAIPHWMGISLIVGLLLSFLHKPKEKKGDEDDKDALMRMGESAVTAILTPLTFLAFAWVYHLLFVR